MNFYANTCKANPNLTIRVHPLLLSLAKTINASDANSDIRTISENDERALRSDLYIPPSAFPSLKIHFSGQNGPSLLSNQNGYFLTSVACCRECMAPAPPQDSTGVEDNLAHISSASLSLRNKWKKRRHASSGGVQGNISNTHGPKVAGVIPRAKQEQVQKAGLWDANPSPPEERSDKSIQEGSDREAEPCMFTGVLVQNFANDIYFSLKWQTMIQP